MRIGALSGSPSTGRFFDMAIKKGIIKDKDNTYSSTLDSNSDSIYDFESEDGYTADSEEEYREPQRRVALPDYHRDTAAVLDRLTKVGNPCTTLISANSSQHWMGFLMDNEEHAEESVKEYEISADRVVAQLERVHIKEFEDFTQRLQAVKAKLARVCEATMEDLGDVVPSNFEFAEVQQIGDKLKTRNAELQTNIKNLAIALGDDAIHF
jgi:hypothetical protein